MSRTSYLAAIILLVTAAVFLRAVENVPAVPLHHPLRDLPLRVAEWRGQSGLLDPETVAALRADDYLLRSYDDGAGRGLILYAAYYTSQPPDTRIHSPAVCLPGAGWVIARTGLERIQLPGRTITVNRDLIQKGDDQEVVLYWFQMQGAVAATELQATSLLAWTSLTRHRSDEALVRINARLVGNVEETVRHEVAFVRAVFPLFRRILPE